MTSCLDSPAAVAHTALAAAVASAVGVEVVLAATALHLAAGRPDATAAVMATLESSGIAAIAQARPAELTAAVPAPDAGADADLLGAIRQAVLAPTDRHDRGAVYTPRHVAEQLCHIAMAEASRSPQGLTVCDPAVGGGVFLLAAADVLAAGGTDPVAIVRGQLWAADVDPVALLATRLALAVWSGAALPAEHTACADALMGGLEIWPDHPAEGFDLVVGNPPFQNQLGRATARSATETAALRARLGPAATGYADTATLFIVAALTMTRPGGHVAMIVPQSFLVARDAAPARDALLAAADLRALWLATDMVFDAQVRVCAPVLRRHGSTPASTGAERPAAPVARFTGAAVEPASPAMLAPRSASAASTWGVLTADLLGVPLVALDDRAGRLADLCRATAGFRDEYYGLLGAVTEARTDDTETWPRLVTSGLVDPGRCLWGRRATKFGRARWEAPVVDVAALDPASAPGRWGRARLVPKVLVATQTRVLEAVVDVAGKLWPSVPVIAVEAPVDRLYDIVAVLLAPPVSAWAMTHFGGAALSADAIKLSARQVAQIPLPLDAGAWADGAAAAKAVHEADTDADWRQALAWLGEAMCRAYAVDGDEVLAWWTARLPPWR